MEAIIFALISYLGWGVGDIFGTIAVRKIGSYSAAFWRMALGVLFFSLFAPFFLNDLRNITLPLFILNIIIGIIGIFGLVAFYEGLKVLNPALAGTIGNSFPFVAIILSISFLKESITAFQILAILVICLGLMFSSIDFSELRKNKLMIDHKFIWPIIAAITFGIYFTFIKIPVSEIGWFWPSYISLATFPILFFFMKATRQRLNRPNAKSAFVPLISLSILWTIGEFSYNFAISRSLVSVVVPIAGSAPTLFVVLAFLVFKDPIKKQQVVGIVTTLIGIVLLSIFSI